MDAQLSEIHKCECGKNYKVYATFSFDQSKCSDCRARDFLIENPTIHCKECGKDFIRQIKDFRKEVLICPGHKLEKELDEEEN